MPKVQVLVESFAGEAVLQEILSIANANTPASMTPAAQPKRDANGKLVSVDVHLPTEISASELATARDAINKNSGVAQTLSFPIGGALENFDSESPGTLLAADRVTILKDIGGTNLSFQPVSTASSRELKAALAADSVGGTGSALTLLDDDIVTPKVGAINRLNIVCKPVNNGLTNIGALRWKADIKFKPGTFLDPDAVDRMAGEINTAGAPGANANLIYNPAAQGNSNWWINISGSPVLQDTGVDRLSYVTMEYTYDLAGKVTVTAGSATSTFNVGFVSENTFDKRWQMLILWGNNTPVAGEMRPLLIDNMEMEILSGS